MIMKLTSGLSERVPQTTAEINLNLSAHFKGYLSRTIRKLEQVQVSYSEL